MTAIVNEEGAADGEPLYADTDGDGFGDASALATVCGTDGWVADATDCDDGDDAVNPGATEVCNTGVDEDCDAGTTCRLEGEVSVRDADVTWLVGGEAGGVPAGLGDQTGDGNDDFALMTTDGLYVLSDPGDGDWDLADAAPTLTNANSPDLRFFHATGGDFDGDGVRDLGVAAISPDVTGDSAVFIFDGPFPEATAATDPRSTLLGNGRDVLGFSLATGADMNGDGIDELIIGEVTFDGTSAVHVMQPGSGIASTGDAWATLYGPGSAADAFGYAVATGDVNDDGLDDLIAATPGAEEERGVLYIFHGPVTGGDLFDADSRIGGVNSGDLLGVSLVFDPFVDADGDGDMDLLLGAWGVSDIAAQAGAAYLFTGPIGAYLDTTDAVGVYAGAHAQAGMGYAVSGAHDIDGDGRGDLMIGANPPSSGDTTGRTYLMYGPGTGTYLESDMDVTFRPEAGGEANRLGSSAVVPGDVDGDGLDDVLMVDPFAETGTGAAYLFRGSGL